MIRCNIVLTIYSLGILFVNADLFAQTPWEIKEDSMNLAILISDYQTYVFEKGHFSVHQPCDSCDKYGIPFNISYTPPGDFGSITFFYTENRDVLLFDATIIWMGGGVIKYPESFLPSDSFQVTGMNIKNPISTDYYQYFEVLDSSLFKLKADSAWEKVRYLDIVEDFAHQAYRIGIYLYTPSVGVFDPTSAKWIFFIYRGKVSPNQISHLPYKPNKYKLLLNYPNPFSKTTTITYTIKQHGTVSVEIYNVSGKKTRTLVNQFRNAGNYTVSWDGTDENNMPVSKGVYYLKLSTGNSSIIQKAFLVK